MHSECNDTNKHEVEKKNRNNNKDENKKEENDTNDKPLPDLIMLRDIPMMLVTTSQAKMK